ncbi:MAG: hypothetical protein MJ211_13695 [Bacteroidales bacterium]|nr:hypothetical protein [Bacteroidales bacterium]
MNVVSVRCPHCNAELFKIGEKCPFCNNELNFTQTINKEDNCVIKKKKLSFFQVNLPFYLLALTIALGVITYKIRFGAEYFWLISITHVLFILFIIFVIRNIKLRDNNTEINYSKSSIYKSIIAYLVIIVLFLFCYVSTPHSYYKIKQIADSIQLNNTNNTFTIKQVENDLKGNMKFFMCLNSDIQINCSYIVPQKRKKSLNDYYFQMCATFDVSIINSFEFNEIYNSADSIVFTIDLLDNKYEKLISISQSISDPMLKLKLNNGCGIYTIEIYGDKIPIVYKKDKILQHLSNLNNIAGYSIKASYKDY